jgi:type IV secretion system protein VirB8
MRYVILLGLALSACSSAPSHELPQTSKKDPIWQLNEGKWTFNDNALTAPYVEKSTMNEIHKITPNRNAELSDSDKRLFDDANTFQVDRLLMGRAAIKAGFWIGGIGAGIGMAGMICAATLFPLKSHENHYFAINQETGWSGPSVGANDAPKLFTPQVIEATLQTYFEARENYLYETDGIAFHRVTLMSTPDEQARYKVMHDAPSSPLHALRDHGYIQVDNFQFWPIGDGKAKTHEYVVKFDRRVMPAGQPVPTKGEPYTVQIAFQFHPEYPMALPDRRLNVTGLQVMSYRVKSDNPTVRTTN